MLSIGNGTARYYAELAERDDYYQQGTEPPGRWHGGGAEEFGLSGEVGKQDFYDLCDGYDPRSGGKLVRNAGSEKRRALWDFTFSGPKGLSVWWASADEKTQERISACHLRAVTNTLDYIEEMGMIGTRRGASGKEIDPCHKLTWALYEHSTSRAQDAQLHLHAVLINVGFNPEGQTRSLDPAQAYEKKMMLGAAYRAELSRELQREFGVEVERLPKGMFDIRGVPEELKAEHSTRRRQILETMRAVGAEGAVAAATFVLTTREKKEHKPRIELFREWAERGREYGLNEYEIVGRREFTQPTQDQAKGMIQGVVAELTREKAYFTETSLLRGLATEAQYTGAGFAMCRAVAAEYLEKEAVYLRVEENQKLYTTPEIDRLEKRMLAQVIEGRDKEFQPIRNQGEIDLSGLSEEQRRAVEYLMDSHGSVKVVNGMAGAGKTTMLRAAREGWEAQGYTVRGAALSSVAARGLETETGIQSENIAQLITGIDNPERAAGPALDSKTILVIDEAGMVDTIKMARLIDEAEKAGARIALVGDVGQLQPIEHGAPFKIFGELIGKSELKEIRRQREEWQREAVYDFAGGRAVDGLTKYQERGLLRVTEKREDAMNQLVNDWSRNPAAYKDKVMIASTRATVGELNRLGQQSRRGRGELGAESLQANGYDFHAGDRILFRKNDRRLKVLNGDRATVQLIDQKSEKIVARMDGGGELRVIPLTRYDKVQLGYAFTTHSLQGDTREASYVLVGGGMQDRELSYVQMSRHRGEAHIYAATEDVGETLETMAEIMDRSRQKAIAQEKRESVMEIAPTITTATKREKKEEVTRAEEKPAPQQRRQQATPWREDFLNEDRANVREAVRALENIAGAVRRNPYSKETASDITAWIRYGQETAGKLGVIPVYPLDAEIKSTLADTFKSLHSLRREYERGQIPTGYAFQSADIARVALSKVQSDLRTWELARSVSNVNGNFDIIAKVIGQGGRVGQLWQHGGPGEHNLSVFTIRNLPGTFTAYSEGIERTSMSFDNRVGSFGYGDPPDSTKVKEIEYDPAKIRAQQIERQQAQAREIERSQGHDIDRGGGISR